MLPSDDEDKLQSSMKLLEIEEKQKYSEITDEWSPFTKADKKCYDRVFLMRLKNEPLSRDKPDIPLLETCNIIRTTPIQESNQEFTTFNPINHQRPLINSLLPNYAKTTDVTSNTNISREPKKDRRKPMSGKGSMKLLPSPAVNTVHRQCISISLSREEVKLNQSKDAWKPTRFKKGNLNEEESKTQELFKKFRGILNKLTPQKFDTLLDKVKGLEINTQARLEGVIDLVFEKAIEEPNFSEAYAVLCSKLSTLKVPCENTPDQFVNFRGLILSKCQNQFMTKELDEQVLKLEKEIADCTDPAKKKELLVLLSEEQRRVRKRSVGNVRFIGELYKLKMLTAKIIGYCMAYLVDKQEEEKLECLCKLLTTIGQQVEREAKDQLDVVFRRMQAIAVHKSNGISSRVRFMIQDVIDLRRGNWVTKNVVDSQPKMMDQILKEAEQQQRNIELMNASPSSRGKRSGDVRRQASTSSMDNQWKAPRTTYTVDTSKFKAVTLNSQKNLTNIKLAPPSAWNQGSRTMGGSSNKEPVRPNSSSMISLSKNTYSILDTIQDTPPIISTKQKPAGYQQSKSIERSTFSSKRDYHTDSSRPVSSTSVSRSSSGRGSVSVTSKRLDETMAEVPQQSSSVAQEPSAVPKELSVVPQVSLPEKKQRDIKMLLLENLDNPNDDEFVSVFKDTLSTQYHSSAITEILNIVIEKSIKDVQTMAKATNLLVSSGTVSSEHFLTGVSDIFECAPDLFIDVPMLYEYLAKFFAPLLEGKHITFVQIFRLSENIIKSNHGHMFLKPLIMNLKESVGPSFVHMIWSEAGLQLEQWLNEEEVSKWLEDNKFEFLVDGTAVEATDKVMCPMETQSKLLQLMNANENCECIREWVQDNVGGSSKEGWFVRSLIQAVCEHAMTGAGHTRFSAERMTKYSPLISEFGHSREQREGNCLFGVQQFIRNLQYPPGLALEIFQFLHEQYIISVEGFTAWELSELEPEGKGVMLKALTSFLTNIKEVDNEDSSGEE